MKLLVPLGLLGLLGIVLLIIIYIIRPNYQVKHINSTYVWKLSLRYRKRKLPTSKIRNLLVFLSQLLILTVMAGIFAMPVFIEEGRGEQYDVIAVIDSSASMYAGYNGETRFLRALDAAYDQADAVISDGGNFSLILADGSEKPGYLLKRVSTANLADLDNVFDDLREEDACYYGSSNIDAAMTVCEDVIGENPTAQVYLYTDIQYEYIPNGVNVVSMAEADEWNAAILNARAQIEDNYYTLTVQIACYGRARELNLDIAVNGANAHDSTETGSLFKFSTSVMCDAGKPITLIYTDSVGEDSEDILYRAIDSDKRFFSFQSIQFSLSEDDSFPIDNNYSIYGGQKPVVKVQYASALPNPFFTGALDVLANEMRENWDLQVTDVRQGDVPADFGFDFYIYEHLAPEHFPMDGVVFLVDPPAGFSNGTLGFRVDSEYAFRTEVSLTAGVAHPVTQYLQADGITVTRYKRITGGTDFETLLTCDTYPVLLARKDEGNQVAIMAFSVHYSNIVERPDFYLLFHNLFEFYFPPTVEGSSFEVGTDITVNSRGPEATVTSSRDRAGQKFTEFPAKLPLTRPDTYTIVTGSYFTAEENATEIYVKIPAIESDISRIEATFREPLRADTAETGYDDLLIYLAAALVLLLFIEWWLQWRQTN